MANTNAPFGFRPTSNVTSLGHRLNAYKIASALAETFSIGDLVKSDGAGGIQKAAAGDAILGVFMGYNLETQGGLSGGSYAGSLSAVIPFFKSWLTGTVIATGARVVALVADDPFEIFEGQSRFNITEAHLGALVNLEDAAPDTALGISRQRVGIPTPGGPITSFTVGAAGSSYENPPPVIITRDPADPFIGEDATATAVLSTGTVASITVDTGGRYSVAPVITFDHAAGGGTGAVATAVLTTVTPSQFKIERIVQKPIRLADSNNNTTGWGLSGTGLYAILELKPMKHERGGSAMGVAV